MRAASRIIPSTAKFDSATHAGAIRQMAATGFDATVATVEE
jgi:hypothetical protein